jgi:dUTP pyrophosphatase
MIKIKIKKVRENAILPKKQKEGDAGFDAYISRFKSASRAERKLIEWDHQEAYLSPLFRIVCCLGFATEIPKGYYAQIVPRSGLALWDGMTIINSPATIDSGYRNEWTAIIVNLSDDEIKLKVGDRICQIIIRKLIGFEFEEAEELNDSERGLDGLGSTGKNDKK